MMVSPQGTWRAVAAAGAVALLLTSCGGGSSRTDSRHSAGAQKPACTVRHEIEPIAARFPELGEIQASTWCGIDLTAGDSRLPGPTDVRLVGVLRAKDAGAVRKIMGTAGWKFTSAAPEEVPREIAAVLPQDAQWVASTDFDVTVTKGAYAGSFYLDRASAQVLFDAVNPVRH